MKNAFRKLGQTLSRHLLAGFRAMGISPLAPLPHEVFWTRPRWRVYDSPTFMRRGMRVVDASEQ